MAAEIERKYLVDLAVWRPKEPGVLYKQGYLSSHPARVVRVRLEGEVAKLTIKGLSTGIVRAEYEYDIPVDDAHAMLRDLCEQPLIEKRRHVERYEGKTWEIDVFLGDNAGLVIAEVELRSEDEQVATPPWVLEEVSGDPRYYNSNLIKAPYKTWPN